MKRLIFTLVVFLLGFATLGCPTPAFGAAPVITNVFVTGTTATTGTISWTTDIPSTSMLKYGTNNTIPFQNNEDYTLVTSHSMTLPLLVVGPLYYVAAVSADGSGNTTQSSIVTFSVCGTPSIPVAGTVNNYYEYGSYVLTWIPPAGASGSPMVCGAPVTTTVSGSLSGSASFSTSVADASKIVPGPGQWQIQVTDAGNLSPISITEYLAQSSQDVSPQLQAAAASAGLTACIVNVNSGAFYPSACGGGVGKFVELNPGAGVSQIIVQQPDTGLGVTNNQNSPSYLTFSNNDPGDSASAGILLSNGTGQLFIGIAGTGTGLPGASAIEATTANAPFLIADNGPLSLLGTTVTLSGGFNYAVDTGTANIYIVPVLLEGSSSPGDYVNFKAANSSSGPSTLSVNGLNAALVKNGSTALTTGDILAGSIYTAVYDGTNWQLLNSSLTGGGGSCGDVLCYVLNPTGTQTVDQPNVGGTQTTTAINSLNNYYYASQFQTGGGDNGIANIAALNDGTGLTGIADPGYASTETVPTQNAGFYGPTSVAFAIPNWPNLTHIIDNRQGSLIDTYSQNAVNTSRNAAYQYYYNSTAALDTVNYVTLDSAWQANFRGPGNQIFGNGVDTFKSYDQGYSFNLNSIEQGQKLNTSRVTYATGTGDAENTFQQVVCSGGYSAIDDEGCNGGDFQVVENTKVFRGTIAAVGTNTLTVTPAGGTDSEAGNGRYIYDLTLATNCAYPTCYISGSGYLPEFSNVGGINGPIPPVAVITGTTVTPSWMGWVCYPVGGGGNCPNSTTVNPSGGIPSSGPTAPGTLTVNLVTQAPSLPNAFATTTAGLPSPFNACVADTDYYETTTGTVIDATHLSINFTKVHDSSPVVSIGGPCGDVIENTGVTAVNASLGTYRQAFPVVGAASSSQVMYWAHNAQQALPNIILDPSNTGGICKTDTYTVESVAGAVVTLQDTISGHVNPAFSNQTVTMFSSTNSAYNGNFVLSLVSANFGLPNQPAYRYTLGSAPGGTQPATITGTLCNSGFNLFPAAEVLQVLNPSTNAVDGYFQTAVAPTTFNVGDSVEEGHYFAEYDYVGNLKIVNQYLPRPDLNSFSLDGDQFYGVSGAYYGFSINNNTPITEYRFLGGVKSPGLSPFHSGGLWLDGIDFDYGSPGGSLSGGALLHVLNCPPGIIGCNPTNPHLVDVPIYESFAAGHYFTDESNLQDFLFGTATIKLDGGFSALTVPVAGTVCASADSGPSYTCNGTLEANQVELWSSTPPPTNFTFPFFKGNGNSIQTLRENTATATFDFSTTLQAAALLLSNTSDTTGATLYGSITAAASVMNFNGAIGSGNANMFGGTLTLSGLTPGTAPICAHGTGGAFTNVGCSGGGGGTSPGGSSGQIQWNNAGAFAGFTMNGDATLNTSTGAVTVTKTGGVAFAASATTDTTNGSNITSGTIAAARIANPLNQNTSGTSGNVSGTPLLPNGTTGFTQSTSDTSADLATDLFVHNLVGTQVADVSISVASFAVPNGQCYGSSGSSTALTVAMTGLTTSMVVTPGFTSSYNPYTVTGWGTIGGLTLKVWPSSANTASYCVNNDTGASITGSAITFNLAAK